MAKGKSKDTSTPPGMADMIAQMQQMGLQSMHWMGSDWMEKASDMGTEVMSFFADRMRQDAEFQHKLLNCKDVTELQHVQAEFLQSVMDDYTAETGKLIEMGQSMMTPPKTSD